MDKIKKALRRLLREQSGQALPIALAMLAIGSLQIMPLLSLTENAIRTGMRDKSRTHESYAANAGIEDGIREIITDSPQLPAAGDNWTYTIPNTNNRTVQVVISAIDDANWKIASTATSGNGHSTTLDCYLTKRSYLANAVTAASATINAGATVNGSVQYDSETGALTNGGTINGEIIDKPVAWPAADEVSAYYLEAVDGAPTHHGDLTLNLGPQTLGNPYSLGPVYIDGDLTISTAAEAAFRLDGAVYVTGSVVVNNNVRMYQNNNSLYADGPGGINLVVNSALYQAGNIIARNDINIAGKPRSPCYSVVWSLEGSVTSNTNGELRGMLYSGEADTAGLVTVADDIVTYAEPPPGLSLPPFPESFRIIGWESRTQ